MMMIVMGDDDDDDLELDDRVTHCLVFILLEGGGAIKCRSFIIISDVII
jgi:hypothetical protein